MLTWCRQETLITYYTQRSTPLKEKKRLYYKQEATNLEINILLKLNISKNSGGSSKFPGGLKLFIGLPKQPLLELSAPVF